MKYFIVQEESEYTIFKVTDNLIEDFKIKMEKSVVIEAKDLQEAINKFEALEKPHDLPFNPAMKKFKEENIIMKGSHVEGKKERIKF